MSDRETLGRLVREVWIAWAREQPNPKPSWLVPWDALAEPDREVDRRIGEVLFERGRAAATQTLAAEGGDVAAGGDDEEDDDQCGTVGPPRDPRSPVCALTPGHEPPCKEMVVTLREIVIVDGGAVGAQDDGGAVGRQDSTAEGGAR